MHYYRKEDKDEGGRGLPSMEGDSRDENPPFLRQALLDAGACLLFTSLILASTIISWNVLRFLLGF